MSRYTVVWLRDAIDELGEIWLAATDRKAVTVASEEIDRSLATDAATKGKPLSEDRLFLPCSRSVIRTKRSKLPVFDYCSSKNAK